MTDQRRASRRDFLKKTAAVGVAAPLVIPSAVFSGPVGSNEKIHIGMIGVGRRAQQLMAGLPGGAQIVAISDVNRKRLRQVADGKPWKTYADYRQMLESKEVDAVMVASPDHWHTLHSIHACQAEKDVYTEKPLTLTVAEGRALVRAARKHDRVVQTGSQQRSMAPSRIGCELVRNGRIGKVHTIHGHNYPSPWNRTFAQQPVPDGLDWDMWCGQAPVREYNDDIYLPRAKPGWISLKPFSGGEMTGWGSHGLDMIQWALGVDHSGPVEVWAEEPGLRSVICYRYADGTLLKLDSKGPAGGALFVGEKGEILVDRNKYEVRPEELGREKAKPSDVRLYVSDHHIQDWLDCIRTRNRPIAEVEYGHRSATVCHLGNIARWTGRKLRWNPEKEEFIGDAEANEHLQRPMRDPWGLPVI